MGDSIVGGVSRLVTAGTNVYSRTKNGENPLLAYGSEVASYVWDTAESTTMGNILLYPLVAGAKAAQDVYEGPLTFSSCYVAPYERNPLTAPIVDLAESALARRLGGSDDGKPMTDRERRDNAANAGRDIAFLVLMVYGARAHAAARAQEAATAQAGENPFAPKIGSPAAEPAQPPTPPTDPTPPTPPSNPSAGTAPVTSQGACPSGTAAGQRVYWLGDVTPDLNRPPAPVPPGAPAPPARSFGGSYVQSQNPLTMTQQELAAFITNNVPGKAFPKRLAIIEVPAGSVVADPSVTKAPPGTGHLPPNVAGSRIVEMYEITYDEFGRATLKKMEGY
jgi:hypothetical protein